MKRFNALHVIGILFAIYVAVVVAAVSDAAPLSPSNTWGAAYPGPYGRGTPALLTAKGTTDNEVYVLEVDPVTGLIPTSATFSGTVTATNPSVGTNGAAAPASSTQVGFTSGGNLVAVSAGNPLPITGSITASNPSVSATGAAVPAQATMAGGSDGTNLRALKVSSTGVLSVDGSAVTQPVSAASLPLPAGAATAANQATAIASLSSIDTKLTAPLTVSGTVAVTPTTHAYVDSARNDYGSTAVTTGAWVQLIASTAGAIAHLQVFDSSGQTLELGTGAAAAETRILIIPPGGISGSYDINIPAATRISVRAISDTAAAGELDITATN